MKIAIIGCGNMGEAILAGIIDSKLTARENIFIYDKDKNKEQKIGEKYLVNFKKDGTIIDTIKYTDYIVLAVKPNIIESVLNEIKTIIGNKIIISIAAGVLISTIESVIGNDKKVIRVMPNTPALVGMGMSSISINNNITNEELEKTKKIIDSFGKSEIVDEKLIDAVIAVSGSAPAYVYMFIEAMADGAVLHGMSRDMAYKFAAQTVMGAAKMVLETGEHPGLLKDKVCSPGGTTIEAVAELEKKGLRSAVISAMEKCVEKSKKMSKKN
ncbi:MAG: pyrroline-5-carboxylate reductase [Fusobacteriaceae bacterium]|jgi:pyrroline-5-carboxylate reductase|nr:pyrroline-5-carboxylate reductase [Fusobacteriales bacterium]MDN5304567.1 pyrroline-5-carboxylate reductase [Fusobacteriaceae bacterium]